MKAAVFLLGGTILVHEVCLLRILGIATFSHAAALVVSVALLGFGAAGTLLALCPALARKATIGAAAALYGALVPGSLALASAVAFNPLEVGWAPTQWLRLLALQGVFLLPFLAGALAVSTALALSAARAGPVYAANLLGSGVGAALCPWLLGLGPPSHVLAGAAAAGAAAGLFVGGRTPRGLAVAGVLAALALAGQDLPMSPFKDLPATPRAKVLETRYGPLGRVDRVETPVLHHAPGLALDARADVPLQQGLFLDGDLVAAIDLGPSDYLDETVGALPFLLAPPGPVVLLGVGPDLARATLVVDPDAALLGMCGRPGVVAEPRAWLEETRECFAVLSIPVSRCDPVHETPLLTVEGLRLALERTVPGGVVALGTRLETPPRAGAKLLATARAVTPHVVAARSVDRLSVVLLAAAPGPDDLARVRDFCGASGFDGVLPEALRPGRPRHRSPLPLLVGDEDYPYDLRPVTDARPYFHKYFRWSRLGDVLDARAVPFVEWGFVALLVAFVQVVLVALALLLVPLLLVRAARAPAPLFLALGLAFMLLEMAFLARASVRLGGASLAAAVVFGGFLVGAGLGSLCSERLGRPLRLPALAAATCALPCWLLLPGVPVGVALCAALVAFPMGMPFPSALGRLPRASVPWALAVNGSAAVAAGAAAPLASSTFGIGATLLAGALLYAAVAALARDPGRAERRLR